MTASGKRPSTRIGRVRAATVSVSAFLLLTGCIRKDFPVEADIIRDVDIEGATAVDPVDVLDRLATASSPRFLGIWDGVVFEYEIFDENVLERDLKRIERYYRSRGYYDAKVTAARVYRFDKRRVRVQIRVYEGQPVLVGGSIRTDFIPPTHPLFAEASAQRTLQPGDLFDEAVYEKSKERIRKLLSNRGYAFAKVRGEVVVNLATKRAQVRLEIEPGPLATYGEVIVTGLRKVPEDKVRAQLGIRERRRYSESDLEEARDALNDLGVFASVEIRQDLGNPRSERVPITVVVREAELRTVRLGGGAEFDQTRLSTHARMGWESRNFFGGVRRFSVDDKPGVVLFPTRIPSKSSNTTGSDTPPNFPPSDYLPENRLRVDLEQPSFFEGRTTGFVSNEFNVLALLLDRTIPPRDEPVIGFLEVKNSTGLKRKFLNQRLNVILSYNWQADFPFTYRNPLPDNREVIVSFPELVTELDYRDDNIKPTRGVLLRNSVQLAGYVFGGSADDVKVQPEIRAYAPLEKKKRPKAVLAARFTAGYVFPRKCGDAVLGATPSGNRSGCYGNSLTDDTAAFELDRIRDQQILLFRGFYSGGANSNRGYGFRGVGPHERLAFLTPRSRCPINLDEANGPVPKECVRPVGGFTLWEASLEARFFITGPLGGALFVDASDVTNDIGLLRVDVPHLSTGFGVRYDTPIGPFRLDIGIRVPRAQQLGKPGLPANEGDPGRILGAPIAIHLGLGEAF